jgi:uncharacterized protein (DUF2147 family)
MIMVNLTRLITASLVFGLIAFPAVAAGVKASPAGSWQTTDGQAVVRVTLCGDGTQLCAKLTGLSGEARTQENLQLLNTYVVNQALLADDNVWQGRVHLNGQTADGNITLVSSNSISVSGCQMGMCKTVQFVRISNKAAQTIADASFQIAPRTVGLTVPE